MRSDLHIGSVDVCTGNFVIRIQFENPKGTKISIVSDGAVPHSDSRYYMIYPHDVQDALDHLDRKGIDKVDSGTARELVAQGWLKKVKP